MSNIKAFWLQTVKTGVFSLVFSCIGVLLLALLAELCNIAENILPIINQVLKVLSVVLGVAVCVKDEKILPKALLGAIFYWLLSFLLFSLLGGAFHWGQIALDLVVSLAAATLVAIIKNRR